MNKSSYPWHCAELGTFIAVAVKKIEIAIVFFQVKLHWDVDPAPLYRWMFNSEIPMF